MKYRIRHRRFVSSALLCIGLLWLCAACQHNEDPSNTFNTGDAEVAFETLTDSSDDQWLDPPTATTRATTLLNSTDDLQQLNEGFGVMAYFTDQQEWATACTGNTVPNTIPFFMANQQVQWLVRTTDLTDAANPKPFYDWVYSPVKYWPNSTANATPRYISFFAYVPHLALADGDAAPTTGITACTATNDDGCTLLRQPHVHYTVGEGDNQTDLIYAATLDCTRNGQGLIYCQNDTKGWQRVPLLFKHALAAVDIYVQRVYDEPTLTGKAPDSEEHTKLFVSKLTFDANNAFNNSGTFNLATAQWVTLSEKSGTDAKKLTLPETTFNVNVRGTTNTTLPYIQNDELSKWGIGYDSSTDTWNTDQSYGVVSTERPLLAASAPLILLPQTLTITPTLTYSMVTRDNSLEHGYLTDNSSNRYTRIVNTKEGNTFQLNLQPGKRHKLVVLIGVETVQFQVASVEDWDFPLRFIPGITDYKEGNTYPKTLDQPDE